MYLYEVTKILNQKNVGLNTWGLNDLVTIYQVKSETWYSINILSAHRESL